MRRTTLFLLPVVIFVGHAALHRHWIVDDAGITFAYAVNLANGHGLVSQPGVAPVEGFSNPTWVFVFAIAKFLGLYHEVWTAKILGLLFAVFSFHLIGRLASSAVTATVACCWLALHPSFVIWNQSGLENPLYASLVLLLCVLNARSAEMPTVVRTIGCSLIATALAATRPEGILWAACFPVICWMRSSTTRASTRHAIIFSVAFGIATGLMFSGRFLYFGDWLPNTYLAKGGGTTGRALAGILQAVGIAIVYVVARKVFRRSSRRLLARAGVFAVLALATWALGAQPPLRAIASDFGLPIAAFIATVLCTRDESLSTSAAAMLFLLCGLVAFNGLTRDWMGEYRFATPFLPFFFLLLGETLVPEGKASPVQWTLTTALAVALVANFATRTISYSRAPAQSLSNVFDHARTYDSVARIVARSDLSVLATDVGGLLLRSKLRVFDLGMLCERRIAETLRRDRPAFHDYVFTEIRPSLIYVHPPHDRLAAFASDSRFARDYEWIFKIGRENDSDIAAGLFIRRELLGNRSQLQTLRARIPGM